MLLLLDTMFYLLSSSISLCSKNTILAKLARRILIYISFPSSFPRPSYPKKGKFQASALLTSRNHKTCGGGGGVRGAQYKKKGNHGDLIENK
ncbi:hypothetical protein BO94DRAFT_302566 [Aspergillus sclerotioniger CBS 115572]|uniref:Uncharacterized protein n=1 Tax=Aspergillus sclerotioniger CBS 115572 TaxID=1450535 RepID=A0A317V6X0_9EURO|nr:hypothetical protein BO94DRAFT_302566 [Aspergillus sclerotioniger CBS 115572]PWY68582.1 hypothetical protein BO94DRAFT_302566 [Aspergillus sclerotioniger CBS 115572]